MPITEPLQSPLDFAASPGPWKFMDATGELITYEYLTGEQEAEIFIRAWNDCAVRFGHAEAVIVLAEDVTGMCYHTPAAALMEGGAA